jgi:hypothetical protein
VDDGNAHKKSPNLCGDNDVTNNYRLRISQTRKFAKRRFDHFNAELLAVPAMTTCPDSPPSRRSRGLLAPTTRTIGQTIPCDFGGFMQIVVLSPSVQRFDATAHYWQAEFVACVAYLRTRFPHAQVSAEPAGLIDGPP